MSSVLRAEGGGRGRGLDGGVLLLSDLVNGQSLGEAVLSGLTLVGAQCCGRGQEAENAVLLDVDVWGEFTRGSLPVQRRQPRRHGAVEAHHLLQKHRNLHACGGQRSKGQHTRVYWSIQMTELDSVELL